MGRFINFSASLIKMFKIKTFPEDFIVKETIKLEMGDGKYSYYLLRKKDYTTMKAVSIIAKKLKLKEIGFAGAKDRRAITEQVISILNGPEKDFELKDINLKFLGKGSDRINLGDNEGNDFEIIVREISKKPEEKKFIVNYFDKQRFSRNNADIGKALVKGNFKKAVELMGNGEYEKEAREYLKTNPNDYAGALRKISRKILIIFVHAYQSYIWNKTAEEYLKTNHAENIKIPIVGFGTELEGIIGSIIKKILEAEGIVPRNFIIKQIPELSSEGSERNLVAEIKNLKIGELEDDELNKGMKKVMLKFFLQKGSYATEAIKQIFQES